VTKTSATSNREQRDGREIVGIARRQARERGRNAGETGAGHVNRPHQAVSRRTLRRGRGSRRTSPEIGAILALEYGPVMLHLHKLQPVR
jgi:hypothetical protein